MKQEKRAPKRRFRKFAEAGEWKYVTLADIADVVGGGTPDTENKEYWDGDIDWYTPSEIGVHAFVDGSIRKISATGLANSSAQMLPAEKTVLFTSRASIGDAAILRHEGTTNQGFQSLVTKDDVDPYFLYSLTGKIKNYALQQAAGSTFIEVSGKNLGQCPLVIPSPREQQTIGEFCRQLDDIISLHERKLQKLAHLKHAYLAEMFPSKGERQPRRRFKGFSGDWDNFLLGECVKIVGGGTPSTDIATYWDGNIDWYTPTEIGTSPYAYESERKISTIGLENSSATILPANKTLLFTSRASIGDAAILRNDGTTNQGFQSLVVDDTIDIYFLYSMSFQIKEYGLQHAAGSTFIEVSGRELKQMPVLFPAIEEQKKIGAFFKSFDRNIMSERKLISKLHALKQAYLSELFV